MIEITDGFTSISAGTDSIEGLEHAYAPLPGAGYAARRPTGARVMVEFRRTSSLSPTQAVMVRYDFAADGTVRRFSGIPQHTRTVVRRGRAVLYHYRLSHWIAASELMDFSGETRRRTDAHRESAEPRLRSDISLAPRLRLVAGATAIDPSPA
jgi:hypothetical protein